ncbi:hypothetical protein AK812_SmicGene3334 [Symbiodinium microadriaticum]|uniref:Uncharacterized protein n=1 Tax=Symbiodinium microadriaticum TaxID=2951 RepID=A0A1Q9EZN9_SYMMI|nr:hypothetical protein AK812_SmicGene3334 [Symbiodinium microadriaticum]
MGTLELATQDVDDCEAIAKQISDELGFRCPCYLSDAVLEWVQDAKREARLYQRASGVFNCWKSGVAAAISTHQGEGAYDRLLPRVEASTGREEPLLDEGFISQAREERFLELWVQKLKQELKDIDARVLGKRQGSLDPDRAANLLVGRTRANTLKRCLTYYKHWRLWLGEAKLRMPRGRPADWVGYLLNRRDEPCGRTVPEALLKAIAWVENVAEFPLELRATLEEALREEGEFKGCARSPYCDVQPHVNV